MNVAGEIAQALGVPKRTTKAVLTLEVGKLPTLAIECWATDANGRPITVPEVQPDGTVARRLQSVRFMVRLVRE